jgi:hypothetical protein
MTTGPYPDTDLARIAGFSTKDWLDAEPAARLDALRSRGAVPDACGPEIPVAPARGAFRVFEPVALYPKGKDDWEAKPSGHLGRKAMRLADAFDRMAVAASRTKGAPPFTPTQVAMGRFYRALFERHEAAGPRCVSLEGGGGSGGGQGSFIDAVLRDRERLGVMRRRIGPGSALVVRRIRPSARGGRATIFDRRAVDMICLEDATCADVLRAHGWCSADGKVDGKYVRAVATAVGDALDRMCGPTFERRIVAAHFASHRTG